MYVTSLFYALSTPIFVVFSMVCYVGAVNDEVQRVNATVLHGSPTLSSLTDIYKWNSNDRYTVSIKGSIVKPLVIPTKHLSSRTTASVEQVIKLQSSSGYVSSSLYKQKKVFSSELTSKASGIFASHVTSQTWNIKSTESLSLISPLPSSPSLFSYKNSSLNFKFMSSAVERTNISPTQSMNSMQVAQTSLVTSNTTPSILTSPGFLHQHTLYTSMYSKDSLRLSTEKSIVTVNTSPIPIFSSSANISKITVSKFIETTSPFSTALKMESSHSIKSTVSTRKVASSKNTVVLSSKSAVSKTSNRTTNTKSMGKVPNVYASATSLQTINSTSVFTPLLHTAATFVRDSTKISSLFHTSSTLAHVHRTADLTSTKTVTRALNFSPSLSTVYSKTTTDSPIVSATIANTLITHIPPSIAPNSNVTSTTSPVNTTTPAFNVTTPVTSTSNVTTSFHNVTTPYFNATTFASNHTTVTPFGNTTTTFASNYTTVTPFGKTTTTFASNYTTVTPFGNTTTTLSTENVTTLTPTMNATSKVPTATTTNETVVTTLVPTQTTETTPSTTPVATFLASSLVSHTATTMMIRLFIPYEPTQLKTLSVIVQEVGENVVEDSPIRTWYEVYHVEKYRYNKYRAAIMNYTKINEYFHGHDKYMYHIAKRAVETSRDITTWKSILIGNGKKCARGLCNGPLKPSRQYRFQLEVVLKKGNKRSFSAFTKVYSTNQQVKTTSKPVTPSVTYGPSSTVLILLAALLITFIVIIVVILVIVFKRRRGSQSICGGRASEDIRTALMGPCHKNGSKRDRFSTSSLITERKKSLKGMTRPVSVRDFRAWVLRSSSDSEFRFAEEFESMREVGRNERHEVADMPENRGKNRYVNILAFDYTRVKLSSIDDEPGSDYINANYIHGYKQPRAYIATQGPLPSTEDDFWRMTWEQNARVVVMVTQCTERGRVKCHHYWPDTGHAQRYGDIFVTPISERYLPGWIEREFVLEYENETRNLKHYQYVAWPDHGVPKSTSEMLKFVQTIKSVQKPTDGPLICHCSAGVGRTGTYLCVDILLNKLQCENNVDVYGVVCMMRTQRYFMVQTEEQYIFIHRVILDYLEQREQYATLLSPNRMQRPTVEGEENNDDGVKEVSALLESEDMNVEIMRKSGFLSEFDPDIYNKNRFSAETKT